MSWGYLIGLLHYLVALVVAVRVMLKPRMAASVRLAWILVIEVLPLVGILAWVLFGEVRMRRADRQRAADVRDAIAGRWQPSPYVATGLDDPAASVVAQAYATGGLSAVSGNRLWLLPEGDEAMEDIAKCIDAAQTSVMVLFYIWLDDRSGRRVAKACADAARRGVTVRVIADAMGSRRFIRSQTWRQMVEAGVEAVEAFPLGNTLARPLTSRMDLRNHRKIVVVDDKRAYTGSRNCSDMEFAVKARFGPWIDILIAIEGPAVRHLEVVFVQDWLGATTVKLTGKEVAALDGHALFALPAPAPVMAEVPAPIPSAKGTVGADHMGVIGSIDDSAANPVQGGASSAASSTMIGPAKLDLLPPVPAVCEPGQIVQVVPTGPDFRPGTLSDVLSTLVHAARKTLTITTPYYVPDEAIDAAIRAAARRGVAVTLILPARNDSRLVQFVSNGFHEDLLRAGVRIALFEHGLIHSKIITVDGKMTLAGSANLDRRSFDLNYEVSLLIVDREFTAALDARQHSYLRRSRWLSQAEVRNRPVLKRLAGNMASLAAPLL